MKTSMRYSLRLLPAAIALLAFQSAAHAQESAVTGTAEADDGTYIETIVVTGSRIPRAGFDTMLPATMIDDEFLSARGFTNAADALNEIPAFGIPGASTQGDQSEYSVGQNFVNFFGLGSQRTLTLVNGRRFVSSNAPTIFSDGAPGLQVDLNVIPSSMIERIETIAVGGAPIYGADAIAGTVNIILKDDFEGFEVGGSFGQNWDENDMEDQDVNLLYGVSFGDGRGNLVFGAEYNEREGLIESERKHLKESWQFREPLEESEFSRVLVRDAYANIVSNGGVATSGDLLIPNFDLGGWGPEGGAPYLQFAPDGSLVPYNVGTPTGNAVWSIGGDGLFLPDVTSLYTPYDRTLINSYLSYEITEDVEFFGEFSYANTNSRELINQPAYQSGLFGDESYALNFSIDHPLLSSAARSTLEELGADSFWLQRASVDLGDRRVDQELDLWRGVAGVRGDFEIQDRTVSWEAAYIKGESDASTSMNELISNRFFYALDVVDTPDGPACRVTVDPDSRPDDPANDFGTGLPQNVFDSCVPLDIFGEGRASADAINYITALTTSETSIEQEVFSLNGNVDLFQLPAGMFYIAAGFEHREEEASFDTDGVSSLGLGRSVAVSPTSGSYETDELYAEFYAPVFSPEMGIPFVFSGSIEGAYRSVDNSLAGKDDIWTIGGRFAPVEDLELRGNATRSVRAPAITELFLPLSGNFVFADDPCDQSFVNEGPNPDTRRANCIADGITDPDNFVSNVGNASVQGLTGGNPDLANETADAWTVGVVIRPRWVEGLTVAIDYVDIELEDAIEDFTLTQIMESCYDQAAFPNSFCDQFTRLPDGQLPATDAFVSGYVNAGQRLFEAYMLDAAYQTSLSDIRFIGNRFKNPGALEASLFLYFPQEDETIIKESVDDNAGEPGNSDVQGQLNLRYLRDSWSFLWQTRYIGEATLDNADTPTSRDVRELDAVWLFNAGVTYDYNEMLQLQLNVNNVFDKTPEAASVAAGVSNVYDNLGRFIRAGVRMRL